jgi:hypothetical protein
MRCCPASTVKADIGRCLAEFERRLIFHLIFHLIFRLYDSKKEVRKEIK